MNELDFIGYLSKTLKGKEGLVKGIGDDAAVIEYTRDKYLLFASDMIIESVHFTKNADPFGIGWKAVAVNVSDIAAMGGTPKYITVSLGVPKKKNPRYVKEIVRGIKTLCGKFGISVAGGDTNASRELIIDVSILGEVGKADLVCRDTAKVDDLIFVTGCLGEGRYKHLNFIPRVKESQMLVKNFKINSMIDISDGLFLDLSRICEASGVGARIYKSLIPVSEKAKNTKDAFSYGEDFELLFTLSISEAKKMIRSLGRKTYIPVSLIGQVVRKTDGLKIVLSEGKYRKIKREGYLHF